MEEGKKANIDEVEFKKSINYAVELIEKFNSITFNINRLGLYTGQLPNIGVYYNNKLVELYKYFKTKNQSFSSSMLGRAAGDYITRKIIGPAAKSLDDFTNSYLHKISLIKHMLFKQTVNQKAIDKYIDYSNQLLNFDIEKEAEKVINVYLDNYMNMPFYDGSINKDIDKINMELQGLNLNTTIAYRNKDKAKYKEPNLGYLEVAQYIETINNMKDQVDIYNDSNPKSR